MEDGELLGYYEVWKITNAQLEKVLSNEFAAPLEDTTTGNIAFLANVWVVDDGRKRRVFRNLQARFFDMIDECDLITGREAKRNRRLRIFTARR